MLNFFLKCFVVLTFSLTNTVHADEVQKTVNSSSTMSLHSLLIQLLKNHDEIKSFKSQVEQAKEQYLRSKGLYYPTMDLLADAGREKINKEFGLDTEENRYYISLRANQLVTDFGKTTNTIARSKIFLEQANAHLESNQQLLMLEGTKAYINIVRARERLKSARQSESRIKELTGIEETLVKKGAGLSSDVLQAKSQLAGAMALRVEAQGELSLAKNRFYTVFYKMPDNQEIQQFEDIEFPYKKLPILLEDAVAIARKQNPELLITMYDNEIALKDINIAKAAFYPQLNLFAEALAKENDDGLKGYDNELSAGVEFRYNLFSGGGDRSALKAALAGKKSVSHHIEYIKYIIDEQVNNSWDQLFILRQRSDLLDQQADIVENFLILAKKERKMGTRSLLDVLNGEINFINAVAASIASRQDTKIAAYNLFFAMGDISLELFEQ